VDPICPAVPWHWLRAAASDHKAVLARHVRFMQPRMEMNVLIQNTESTRTVEASDSLVDKVGNLWCTFMHDSPSWPVHGHYTCLACGRRYLVMWEREEGPLASPGALKNANLPANAEHLNSASAVLDNSRTAFARVQ
jgi:hypothetical protein